MRRRFVDWNVFHVEPGFAEVRARYRRISGQRSAWLRSGAAGPAVWDRPYAEALVAVGRARHRFMDQLAAAFGRVCEEVGWYEGLALEWRTAVADVGAVLARLEAVREADMERGYTSAAGSRDDFRLVQDGRRWVGSRGEAKAVGVLLQLAGQAVVEEAAGSAAVWLVDDLAAELSDESCHRLFRAIEERAPQVLVTALPGRAPRAPCSVFHVEQGAVDVIRPHLRVIAQ